MTSIKQIIVTVLIVFFALVIQQYRVRNTNSLWKPSLWLNGGADKAQAFWQYIGAKWAWVCSYLAYLELEQLVYSVVDIIDPIWKVIMSWMYFFKGFAEQAGNYAVAIAKPYTVYLFYLGWGLLVSVVVFIIYWFSLINKLMFTRVWKWFVNSSMCTTTLHYLGKVTEYICPPMPVKSRHARTWVPWTGQPCYCK